MPLPPQAQTHPSERPAKPPGPCPSPTVPLALPATAQLGFSLQTLRGGQRGSPGEAVTPRGKPQESGVCVGRGERPPQAFHTPRSSPHPPGPRDPGPGRSSSQGAAGPSPPKRPGRPAPLPSGPRRHRGDTATLPPTQRKASAKQATVPLDRLRVNGPGTDMPMMMAGGGGLPERPAPSPRLSSRSGGGGQPRGSAGPPCLLRFFLLPVTGPEAPSGLLQAPRALAGL